MKEHGRTFQCEPCRQIIIFFAVSDSSPYIQAARLPIFQQRSAMKILTDDPDWKREVYEARALAMTFVGRSGRSVQGGRQAVGNGLTVTYRPDRSPVQLMIDAAGDCVLSIDWKPGDAWRMEIETYNSGRWRARLKAAAHPRPWLERWRSLVTFTGTLPRGRSA
jgi:hypothetical protein